MATYKSPRERVGHLLQSAEIVRDAYMNSVASHEERIAAHERIYTDDLLARFEPLRHELEMVPAGADVPMEEVQRLFDVYRQARTLLHEFPEAARLEQIIRFADEFVGVDPRCPYGNKKCPNPGAPVGRAHHPSCIENKTSVRR